MIGIRIPDVKAPRYRQQVESTTDAAFIIYIKERNPSLKKISAAEIRKIINTFNNTIYESVVANRDGVELPEFLGKLFIGTCPPKKRKNVDFKRTTEYQHVVQHRNWESDNFLAKIFYSVYDLKHSYKNHELYGFKACRKFSRLVGQEYPKNWKMYIQIDPKMKISGLFRQTMARIERKDRTEEYLVTYDEFEF